MRHSHFGPTDLSIPTRNSKVFCIFLFGDFHISQTSFMSANPFRSSYLQGLILRVRCLHPLPSDAADMWNLVKMILQGLPWAACVSTLGTAVGRSVEEARQLSWEVEKNVTKGWEWGHLANSPSPTSVALVTRRQARRQLVDWMRACQVTSQPSWPSSWCWLESTCNSSLLVSVEKRGSLSCTDSRNSSLCWQTCN